YRTVAGSPFVHYLKATPLGAQFLAAPELQKLEAVDQFLQEQFHVTISQLRDDLFGDALVLCYRPRAPGKPELEQGLLLLHARNEKLLARLLDDIQDKQRESGDLQSLEPLMHRGLTYYRRTERSKPPTYYFVHGKVFGFSSQEFILRQALE